MTYEQKVINTLEYNKIIDKLVSFAASAPGKDKCRRLLPMNSLSDIENAQTLTSDALTRIYRKGAPYFSSVKNISASFLRLQVGSVLGAGELLGIASVLTAPPIVLPTIRNLMIILPRCLLRLFRLHIFTEI